MQLNSLQSRSSRMRARSIGRGGKRGKTSGRGTKGQRARAGHKIRPAMRDIIKKIPKLRGYRFQSIQEKPFAVALFAVAGAFPDGGTVTPSTLRSHGLLKGRTKMVKILGVAALNVKLTVKNCLVSASARGSIEKAGGSVI